jgi:hypothetical protein
MEIVISLRLGSRTKAPEIFLAELGMPADKSWRLGDRRGNTRLTERENGYEFIAEANPNASIDEQAAALLVRLDPVLDRIAQNAYDFVQLVCVVYSPSPPALNFPSDVIRKLGQIGASIDVDMYLVE